MTRRRPHRGSAGHRRAPARARGAGGGPAAAGRALARLPVSRPVGDGQAHDRARVRRGPAARGRARPRPGGRAHRARFPPRPDLGDAVGRLGNARRRHRGARGGGCDAHAVRILAARVRDRVRRRDERPGGQPHAQDARGAAGVRAPAAADRSSCETCSRRSPRAVSWCASIRCPPARIAERLEGAEPRSRAGVREPRARGCAPGGAAGERGGRRAARERRGVRSRDAHRRHAASARGCRCSTCRRPRRRPPARSRRRGSQASSSCCRARSASATNARGSRRGGAASGARARTRSTSRCGWPSCGCATCCASAKGPAS